MTTLDTGTHWWIFHPNLEGEVTIRSKSSSPGSPPKEMRLSGAELLTFFAEAYLRPEVIRKAQTMPIEDLLLGGIN